MNFYLAFNFKIGGGKVLQVRTKSVLGFGTLCPKTCQMLNI